MNTRARPGSTLEIGAPGSISIITIATRGTVSAAANQNRRVMSRSSGLSSLSTVTVRGSSAMPHFGQSPGSSRTTSGCMGQVHSVRVERAGTPLGSSAMPHDGQSPGPTCSTSGCMGHVNTVPAGSSCSSALRFREGSAANFSRQRAEQKRYTRPSCSWRWVLSSLTLMPHTGSRRSVLRPWSAWWQPLCCPPEG